MSRIDPAAETAAYTAKIMAARGKDLDAAGRALLEEDLKSPCTEEVAVFHAFSRIVSGARSSFVVLDTAPTGHSLLLMDATGAYHRQVLRDSTDGAGGLVVTPLMRLQNPDYSRIILVTLAETTPVSEAAALQEDLRRARIEPFAWVINQSLAATGTRDPVLALRAAWEREQIERVRKDLAGVWRSCRGRRRNPSARTRSRHCWPHPIPAPTSLPDVAVQDELERLCG